MATYPGTTIEVIELKKGASRQLFDGIFAAGGITLSQLSNMTGLEPHVIQNWVKRRFVSSPVKKMYSTQQFARVVIINMLRDTLQIEAICNLINIIGGDIDVPNDDLICDDELYHTYVDMISEGTIVISNAEDVKKAVSVATQHITLKSKEDRSKLEKVLQVMLYAHSASKLRDSAKEVLALLD